jgi:hypothetical protein
MKQNSFAEGALVRPRKTYSKLFDNKWALLLLVVAFTTGCKKVIEERGLTGVCPLVVSTTPANETSGININTGINATFNEAMNASTITASSFTVRQGSTLVQGMVSYAGLTASFSPTSNLALNTAYTATISKGVRDPAGNAMVDDYTWTFTTGSSSDVTRPTVVSTDPVNGATGVMLNKKVSITFSEVMKSSSIINPATFILKQGTTAVTGTITYAGVTAVFSPSAALASNTVYTATITTAAQDLAGNAMLNDYTWSFTTGVASDNILPTVIFTDPVNGATGVVLNKKVTATFSEAMNILTINNGTFLLKQGSTPVAGTVTHTGTTATFSPSVNLTISTVYTATITTGAQDLSGNGLAANYVWSFTTGTATPPPFLGSASIFGAFGGSAGITNQGINTVVNNGSIGTTGASTLVTGFHDGTTGDVYTETPLNIGNVTGRIYTAPPFPGTATSFGIATQALLDATAAYNSISPASQPGGIDPGAGELGGLTLPPGVYKSASGTFKITTGNLTLNAMGDPNARWIFQTAAGLTVGIPGPSGARSVMLINGAQAGNVYWYVGSAATINGAGGGVMTGTILSSAGVTFSTAGNTVQTVLNGRAISLNASVTLVNTTINVQ